MTLLAASFMDVFSTIAGVLCALTGLAAALMGLVAVTEGAKKRGSIALVSGAVVCALGLWLIGVFG